MEIYNKHQKIAESEEVAKKIWQHIHFKAGIASALLCVFSLLFYTLYLNDTEKVSPQRKVEADNLKVGVFMTDPNRVGEEMPSNDTLKKFDAQVGKKTDIFLWYQSISDSFAAANFYPMADNGRTIQLAWEPDAFGGGVSQPNYQLKDITSGSHDQEINRLAKQLKDYGREVLFRPMSEMNGDGRSWDAGNAMDGIAPVNGNQPADFVPAWRHIYDIFKKAGVTNAKFVWSPNRDGSPEAAKYTFDNYYPGDNYVDYVGLNGYNWGTLYNTPERTSSWQSLEDVFGPSYDTFSAKTAKPFMISETASNENGGDKAAWIKDTYQNLTSRFPRVKSITWFNINKETDWRVDSTPGSLTAFQNAMKYIGTPSPTLTATITSPAQNASVLRDVTISATTGDNPSVIKMEFYVDNQLKGTATAPVNGAYQYVWDSKEVQNGSHTISLKTYDKLSRISQVSENITVQNIEAPVYHFYNDQYNNFYTTDDWTKNYLVTNLPNSWWYQEVSFKAYKSQQPGSIPVYEFYIPSVKKNYYTTSEYQKNYIISNLSSAWNYSDVAFYEYPKQVQGTVPVYQYYNSFTKGYLYTTDLNEPSKYAYSQYFKKIGIAFYAYKK